MLTHWQCVLLIQHVSMSHAPTTIRKNRLWSHVEEDIVYTMIMELSAFADECIGRMKENQETALAEDAQAEFAHATLLPRMPEAIQRERKSVRDHDHRMGCDRGRLLTDATLIALQSFIFFNKSRIKNYAEKIDSLFCLPAVCAFFSN